MNKSINGQRSAQNQNSCPKNGLYIYRVESIFRAQILVLCRTMYVMRRTVTVLRRTEIVLHRMDSILHRQRSCCAEQSPFCAEQSLKLVPEKQTLFIYIVESIFRARVFLCRTISAQNDSCSPQNGQHSGQNNICFMQNDFISAQNSRIADQQNSRMPE